MTEYPEEIKKSMEHLLGVLKVCQESRGLVTGSFCDYFHKYGSCGSGCPLSVDKNAKGHECIGNVIPDAAERALEQLEKRSEL